MRQIKNLLTTLFVSRNVPMLLGGDEFPRTQGNNNAYCHNKEALNRPGFSGELRV